MMVDDVSPDGPARGDPRDPRRSPVERIRALVAVRGRFADHPFHDVAVDYEPRHADRSRPADGYVAVDYEPRHADRSRPADG